jgi:hypothetical protein
METQTTFWQYDFQLLSDGSILFDRNLQGEQLNIVTGDLFEAIIVPDAGIMLKRLPK